MKLNVVRCAVKQSLTCSLGNELGWESLSPVNLYEVCSKFTYLFFLLLLLLLLLFLPLSVKPTNSAGLQQTGCCPTRRCDQLWESCAALGWEVWPIWSRTLRSSNTATFPTFLVAQVCIISGCVTAVSVCRACLTSLIMSVCVCLCCSAWSCWQAGVWNT